MAEKILYILGAGASVNALPLAKSVWGTSKEPDIMGLAYSLKTTNLSKISSETNSLDQAKLIRQMEDRFKKLGVKADEFGDVDTFAKYLNLQQPGGNEIEELKTTLSEYFILKQTIMDARDRRYFPWLVSIMNKKRFPENVKILSWNYDFQVQLAASQIGSPEDIEHQGSSFTYSPCSTFYYYPNLDPTFNEFNLLSLIHLNGIAGFTDRVKGNCASVFQKKFSDGIESLIKFMEENKKNTELHFAWERSEYHKDLINRVKNMISGTTILVVIGYSFPFFNREYDKEVFKELKKNIQFSRIYYQDPILTGQQLKSQFELNSDIKIVHIQNTTNFYIPFEY